MTRFLTKHEIKKNEKLLNEETLLNASKYKMELRGAINFENQRINIDSAKKKAVLQGMNYDGFHQMVLGADLKGVKTSELMEFKPKGIIMNSVLTQQMYTKEIDFMDGNFVKIDSENISELDVNLHNLNIKDKLSEENSINNANKLKEFYRHFKKVWKSYKPSEAGVEDKIKHVISNPIFEGMINCDLLESDFFLEIIFNIGSYILTQINLSNKESVDLVDITAGVNNIDFLIKCLNSLIKHEKFSNLKKFIGKKHKAIYTQINESKSVIQFQKNNNDSNEEILNLFQFVINNIIN